MRIMRNRKFYPYIPIILSLQLSIYSVPPVYSASPILFEDRPQAIQSAKEVQTAIESKVPSGSLNNSSQPLSSATQEDKIAPTVPRNVQGRAVSASQINLTWTASKDPLSSSQEVSGVAGYRVYRDGVLMKVKTGPSEEDRNLKPNTTYRYQIQAVDAAGNVSALSAPVEIKTPALRDTQAPSAVTNLKATVASSTQINLTWTASKDPLSSSQEVSGVAGYRVYRDGVLMKVKTRPSEEDKNLKPNTTYRYQIQAIDAAGNLSALSAVVEIKTPALRDTQAPSAVTNLKASVASSTQINLTWTASKDPLSSSQEVSGVAGYRVFRNGTLIAKIAAPTYQDKNLEGSTAYTYEVKAYDAAGNVSSANAVVQVKLPDEPVVPQAPPQPADTVEIPSALLNADEITAIKAKIAAGEEPWKSSYQRLLSKANAALAEAAPSVIFQGSSAAGQSENVYNTMRGYHWTNNKENMPADCSHPAEYRCDGQLNPLADRADLVAAQAWSTNVLLLAQAYAFSGDNRYAEKAVEMIRVWTIDPKTRMLPVLPSNAIEVLETFQGALYGADLIRNYAGWKAAEKDEFKKWVQALSDAAERRTWQNNWENERWVFVALAATVTGDTQALKDVFEKYRQKLPAMIGPKGEMLLELNRTKSLDYSMLALAAMTRLAEIARHHGVDLYTYTVEGRNLELSWDFHVPYLLDPSKWPWEQILTYKGSFTFLYEIAYLREHKASYLEVINKYQRPMDGGCMMGQVTLTHAYGAYKQT